MGAVGQAAALVLALVFNAASMSKARRLGATRDAFGALGLPAPALLAYVVPVAELGLAVALLAVPGLASWAALVLLGAFSVVLGRAVARGSDAPCACFGGGRGDEPVSVASLVRNAMLAVLAIVATTAPGPGWPGLPALIVVTLLVAVGRVLLAAVDVRPSLFARVVVEIEARP